MFSHNNWPLEGALMTVRLCIQPKFFVLFAGTFAVLRASAAL